MSASPPLHIPESPGGFIPLSPFSPTSTTSSLPSGRHWQTFSALAANAESTGSSGSSSSPVRRPTIPPLPGLEVRVVPFRSPFISLTLVLGTHPDIHTVCVGCFKSTRAASHFEFCRLENFLPHASQFGFFLHVPTFRNATLLAYPSGHPSRPTPGLLYAVQLMGTHFSQPESQQVQETPFLILSVQNTATDLFSSHPNKLLHTLQAEILLAYYFLRTGSLLEAKVHTGAAVSIALGAGLHKIRSANMVVPSTIALIQDQPYSLPPPLSGIEEAERINGFWAVLTLHKFITAALEPPANVCGALEAPGMQIDTPWPVDMDTIEASFPPIPFIHFC